MVSERTYKFQKSKYKRSMSFFPHHFVTRTCTFACLSRRTTYIWQYLQHSSCLPYRSFFSPLFYSPVIIFRIIPVNNRMRFILANLRTFIRNEKHTQKKVLFFSENPVRVCHRPYPTVRDS